MIVRWTRNAAAALITGLYVSAFALLLILLVVNRRTPLPGARSLATDKGVFATTEHRNPNDGTPEKQRRLLVAIHKSWEQTGAATAQFTTLAAFLRPLSCDLVEPWIGHDARHAWSALNGHPLPGLLTGEATPLFQVFDRETFVSCMTNVSVIPFGALAAAAGAARTLLLRIEHDPDPRTASGPLRNCSFDSTSFHSDWKDVIFRHHMGCVGSRGFPNAIRTLAHSDQYDIVILFEWRGLSSSDSSRVVDPSFRLPSRRGPCFKLSSSSAAVADAYTDSLPRPVFGAHVRFLRAVPIDIPGGTYRYKGMDNLRLSAEEATLYSTDCWKAIVSRTGSLAKQWSTSSVVLVADIGLHGAVDIGQKFVSRMAQILEMHPLEYAARRFRALGFQAGVDANVSEGMNRAVVALREMRVLGNCDVITTFGSSALLNLAISRDGRSPRNVQSGVGCESLIGTPTQWRGQKATILN